MLKLSPHLAVKVAFLNGLLFLVSSLALSQGYFNLDFALVVEEHLGGDEGVALFSDFPDEPLNFLTMEEELALAERLVVEPVGGLVGTDVGLEEKDFSVAGLCIAVLQADPSLSD